MSALVPTSQIPTAVATVVVSLGVAVVYLFVGFRLFSRPISAPARLASAQFSLWWAGLGISVAITGVEVALALVNALSFPLAATFYFLTVLIDCVFLWGLVGFLTYVYTGRYYLFWVSAFYVAFYLTVLYYVFSRIPYAVTLVAGQPTLEYMVVPSVAFDLVILLGLLGPEIAGAILYLSLLRRTRDSAQRYRISLVGGGILLWFGILIFVPSSTAAWELARTVLEVIPGLLSVMAFFPPEWARRRYGASAGESATPAPTKEVATQP